LARFRTTTILRPLELFFYSSFRSKFQVPAKTEVKNVSGNLRDACGLDDGRAALAIGKAGSFLLIRIDAAESFAVGVIHRNQKMMMPAPAVFTKLGFFIADRLSGYFRCRFCHVERLDFLIRLKLTMTRKANLRK
jgi:hypothetical protein